MSSGPCTTSRFLEQCAFPGSIFDLADRVYRQAIGLLGPTAMILNNQGYSYMLRCDYNRARQMLLLAQRKDPDNKFIANNLRRLNQSARKAKGIE
jgi:Flp pilus assembly protein TadD